MSVLNPLQRQTEFISFVCLCTEFLSYTLDDLFDAGNCFEQQGFAFKEIVSVCKDINFTVSLTADNTQ